MNYSKLVLSVIAVTCIVSAVPVIAEEDAGFYLGAGLARSDINDDDFKSALNQFGLRVGYMFNDNVGIDFTSALRGDTTDDNVKVKVGMFSLSLLGSMRVGEKVDIYGKLGMAEIEASVDFDNDFEVSADSSTEIMWGLGGELDFGVTNLFLEYSRFDTDDLDVNTLMGGVKFEFGGY